MDRDKMLDLWEPVVVGLALAHDKDEQDGFEAQINQLLTPLLSAPVKQLREFYSRLTERLKSNPQVPFIIWRAFEVWGDGMIAKAPDEGVVKLKTELAREIAEMVEEDVKPDLREAIVRALMWRDPDRLEEVKQAVEEGKKSGRKARMVGRESCLFLEVPRGRGKKRATVML